MCVCGYLLSLVYTWRAERVLGSVAVTFVARAEVRLHAVVGADRIRRATTPPATAAFDYRCERTRRLCRRCSGKKRTLIGWIAMDHTFGTVIRRRGTFFAAVRTRTIETLRGKRLGCGCCRVYSGGGRYER